MAEMLVMLESSFKTQGRAFRLTHGLCSQAMQQPVSKAVGIGQKNNIESWERWQNHPSHVKRTSCLKNRPKGGQNHPKKNTAKKCAGRRGQTIFPNPKNKSTFILKVKIKGVILRSYTWRRVIRGVTMIPKQKYLSFWPKKTLSHSRSDVLALLLRGSHGSSCQCIPGSWGETT